MSAYGYGPPPPPPPPSSAASGGTPYGLPSGPYTHHGQSRGGGSSSNRGRGGHHHGGRGDHHSSQPRYEYVGQPYPAHNPVPYGGSHPPAASSYPHPPSWAPDHGHAPPHHAHAHAHPHAPAPISASNYHPNYAPQPYTASSYPQPAPYASQPLYAHPYQVPPPPAQPQWNGQGSSHQPSYGGTAAAAGGGGSSRSRGGYGDRGGSTKSAAPARHGFEREAAQLPLPPLPPMTSSYGQPYAHDPRAVPYPPPPQFPYASAPPPPGPPHQSSYYGQYPRRGRNGGHRDGSVRGRGGHHGNHQGGDKSRHQKLQPQNSNANTAARQESPSVGKKKKRKTNTLGLTPGADSESEPDDEREGQEDEKVLAELLGKETPAIDDVAKYLEQRRRNFPTKARIEAKKAAELAQVKEDKAASLEKEADRLRKQLRKVEFSIKRKREQGDEGDEMRDPSDESSDDEKPDVMSSRSQAAPPIHLSSGNKADVSRQCKYYSTGGTCGKKGKCRFVHDPEIREAALKEREANNGRLTIQQRLILNDKEQEDLAILQSIQYLRDKGLMNSSVSTVDVKDEEEKKRKQPASTPASIPVPRPIPPPVTTSTLPPPSSSLPPPPVKREPGIPPRRINPPPSIIPNANSVSAQGLKHYEGWLLQPYGSTSGKQVRSDNLP